MNQPTSIIITNVHASMYVNQIELLRS